MSDRSSPFVIDVVIPYVGDPALLRHAVTSVLRQPDADWRLIVVEDGPQGHDVAGWLASLGDERVIHVLHERNWGLAATFQHCLELATAPWVVFPGCDDVLGDNYLGVVRAAIARYPSLVAVQPGVHVISANGDPARPLGDRIKGWLTPQHGGLWSGEPLLQSLFLGNWTYFPSICWRRQAIASVGFRQDLPVTLDLALLAELVLGGGALATTPEVAFRYRRHAASVSSRAASAGRFAEEARLHRDLAAACRELGWTGAARAARLRPTSRLHAAVRWSVRVRANAVAQASRYSRPLEGR